MENKTIIKKKLRKKSQKLEEAQFGKELKYTCVKYATISHSKLIIEELSEHILMLVNSLEEPKQDHLKPAWEINRKRLVDSAYVFVKESKKQTETHIEITTKLMSHQLLKVQNQQFFSHLLYVRG